MSYVTNHTQCGYINDKLGAMSFQNNASFFSVIHPVLWDLCIDSNKNLDICSNSVRNNPEIINIIYNTVKNQQGNKTLIWPMVNGDKGADVISKLIQTLQSPDLLNTHINTLVEKVLKDKIFNDIEISGIEIDYEHIDNSVTDGFRNLFIGLKNHPDAMGKQVSVSLGAVTEVEVQSDPQGYPNDWYYYPFFA